MRISFLELIKAADGAGALIMQLLRIRIFHRYVVAECRQGQ